MIKREVSRFKIALTILFVLVCAMVFCWQKKYQQESEVNSIFDFSHYPHTLALTNTYTVLEQPPTESCN